MLLSIFLVFLAFSIWSLSGVAINLLTLGPVGLACTGAFTAVVITASILTLQGKKSLTTSFTSQKKFVLLLFTFQGLHGVLWIIALKITPIGQAVFLHSISPLFILLIAGYLIKEKYTIGSFIAVFIGLFGLSIILWGDLYANINSNLIGVSLSLFTAFLAAIAAMSVKKLSSTHSSTQLILIMMLGQFFFSSFIIFTDFAKIISYLFEGVLFGIIFIVIPFYLHVQGFKKLKTAQISLIGYSEPVFASIWGSLFLNQKVTFFLLLGGTFIILANYLAVRFEKR